MLPALIAAGCSTSATNESDTGAASATPRNGGQATSVPPVSVPTADLPGNAGDVVLIRIAAFPEGPVLEVNRTDVGAEHVFDLLPDQLPAPLDQPTDCAFGNITSLELRDGDRVDYGPCLRPDTIDALREAAITIPSAAAADDSRFFGRVVSHELLDGYRGTRVAPGWAIGPMILNLADGQSLLVAGQTRINSVCAELPVEDTVTSEPCFIVATADEDGWVTRMRVLSYGLLHEGDRAPSLFTTTGGAIEVIPDDGIALDEDGTVLFADLDRLDVACAGITDLSQVPSAEVAGVTFVLDPATGEVMRITCSVEF